VPLDFADRAREVGVDGVLVVDYPPEEAAEFAALLDARGLAPIFLLSPTTPEPRIIAIGNFARGYVYYVSLKGVTGATHLDTADVARKAGRDPPSHFASRGSRFRHSRRGECAGHCCARRRCR
jgi:tryptophan synthase alpha subunit